MHRAAQHRRGPPESLLAHSNRELPCKVPARTYKSHLVTPGRAWSHLVAPGHTWSRLVTPGRAWDLAVSRSRSSIAGIYLFGPSRQSALNANQGFF